MITILFVTFCFYLIAELVKQGAANKARRRAEARQRRIEEDMRRDREERKRIAEENKRIAAEQIEQAKAQARLERETKKLETEQAKQAAVLEKHEKRIAALECKVRKLDRDITAINERICEYYGQLDWYILQQSGTANSGKEFRKWQDKIESTTDKIRKAENKVADMEDARAMAEREMEAA